MTRYVLQLSFFSTEIPMFFFFRDFTDGPTGSVAHVPACSCYHIVVRREASAKNEYSELPSCTLKTSSRIIHTRSPMVRRFAFSPTRPA